MKYSTKLMVVPYTNKPFDNDEAYMHKLDNKIFSDSITLPT